MHGLYPIKNTYKKMSDSQIETIALFESVGLEKKSFKFLKDEIKIRDLNSDLLNWVNADYEKFRQNEINNLVKDISSLPCPKCQKDCSTLYGYEINKIISFFLYANESKKEKVLCSKCGNKEKALSITQNLFLGWWSRNGIFSTPYLLIKDIINLFKSKEISNQILNDMIIDNTGYLRMNGTDKKTLIDFVSRFNKR